jgi:hypothetical protein
MRRVGGSRRIHATTYTSIPLLPVTVAPSGTRVALALQRPRLGEQGGAVAEGGQRVFQEDQGVAGLGGADCMAARIQPVYELALPGEAFLGGVDVGGASRAGGHGMALRQGGPHFSQRPRGKFSPRRCGRYSHRPAT